MRKILLLAALAACGADDRGPAPDALVVHLDDASVDAPPVPACSQLLPTDAPCCELACTDPAEFKAQCGLPDACVDYACPLADGSFYRPGVCP